MELIPPGRWQHVAGKTNPAHCASKGLYPSELVQHKSWWNGPSWLHDSPSKWPVLPELVENPQPNEEKVSSEELLEIGLVIIARRATPSRENFQLWSLETRHCVGVPFHT